MSETIHISGHEANPQAWLAALGRIRACLERYGRGASGAAPNPDAASPSEEGPEHGPDELHRLRDAFRLSPFERDVLLLCAGVELDASFASLVASVQAQNETAPTFSLALAALPEAHWSAIAPDGALRRWQLIEVGSSDRLVTSPLRMDERVLHYVLGLQVQDAHLRGFVEPVTSHSDGLLPSHARVAEAASAVWQKASSSPHAPLPVLQLVGASWLETQAVAAVLASHLGRTLYTMDAHVLPGKPHERDVLMRLWEREAILSAGLLLIAVADPANTDGAPSLRHFLSTTDAPLVVTGLERLDLPHRPVVTFDVKKPTAAEQRARWTTLLGERAGGLNGHLDRLVSHFDLSTPAIEAAFQRAQGDEQEPDEQNAEALGENLWAACRSQARPQLRDLARSITPVATWDELVLPERPLQMLREMVVHVRRRMQVYESWGFRARSSRGLGISALFAGPSGTGKTMAAEVLANALDLDLYRIDLSRVVSKYIGETEKNLARVFDAAESGGAILLFDEADALFGKRSEVKDSHDRYANIEVSYLLQRMEAYRGLAVLTTNRKSALDEAFLRRLRFIVSFPFPDAAQRAAIWQRIFPPETPTDGLEVDTLARLNVTGGTIRNIALGAAFLAADAGQPVQMVHVIHAARSEYAKLERPLTDIEVGGWT